MLIDAAEYRISGHGDRQVEIIKNRKGTKECEQEKRASINAGRSTESKCNAECLRNRGNRTKGIGNP